MIAKRSGNCVTCGIPVKQQREFLPQLELFTDKQPEGITPEMRDQILAWRDKPILCEVHRND